MKMNKNIVILFLKRYTVILYLFSIIIWISSNFEGPGGSMIIT